MALICCPNCNKEISDKAKVCVGCGHKLVDDINTENAMINCPECNVITDTLTDTCPNCGYPFNTIQTKIEETQKGKKVFKKKWFWCLTICMVLLITVILFASNGAKKENYNIEICTAVDEIMAVSADAETIGNQIQKKKSWRL